VRPTMAPGRSKVQVAYDGEVARVRPPIVIRVLDTPLQLLQAPRGAGAWVAGSAAT
jgi:hypothetical protein